MPHRVCLRAGAFRHESNLPMEPPRSIHCRARLGRERKKPSRNTTACVIARDLTIDLGA